MNQINLNKLVIEACNLALLQTGINSDLKQIEKASVAKYGGKPFRVVSSVIKDHKDQFANRFRVTYRIDKEKTSESDYKVASCLNDYFADVEIPLFIQNSPQVKKNINNYANCYNLKDYYDPSIDAHVDIIDSLRYLVSEIDLASYFLYNTDNVKIKECIDRLHVAELEALETAKILLTIVDKDTNFDTAVNTRRLLGISTRCAKETLFREYTKELLGKDPSYISRITDTTTLSCVSGYRLTTSKKLLYSNIDKAISKLEPKSDADVLEMAKKILIFEGYDVSLIDYLLIDSETEPYTDYYPDLTVEAKANLNKELNSMVHQLLGGN